MERVDCDGDKDGDGKSCKDGCSFQPKVVWFDWNVGGKGKGDGGEGNCHARCSKKLLKKEVEVEIKGAYDYKWEVVNLCKGCEQKSLDKAPEVAPDAEVPPPPAVAARIIHGRPTVQTTAMGGE